MGRASPAIGAFNAGEFSPHMEGRTDTEKYPLASYIQQNFIALKQGPATFRQGSAYVQPVRDPQNQTWLRHFEYSQTQAFMLEFGDGYVRFYSNHGPVLATGVAPYDPAVPYVLGNLVLLTGIVYYCTAPTIGNDPPNAAFWYPMSPYNGSPTTAIYEIPSPYAVADLTDANDSFALQFSQSADVLYIAGGYAGAGANGKGYPPYTLTRYSNSPPNWQFAQYAPLDGPFADKAPLVPGSNIALTVDSTSGTANITAWGGTPFAPTDVGRLIRIAAQIYNVPPWQTQNSAITVGTTCSNNGNNYVALTAGTTGSSPPVHTQGAVYDGQQTLVGIGAVGVLWQYTDSGYGVARITAYTDGAHVAAKVLVNFPTAVFSTGAFPITSISQAAQAQMTLSTVPVGTPLFITGCAGMTQINGNIYTAVASAANTVTLGGQYANSTNYGAYTGSGSFIYNATTQWQLGSWSDTTEWPQAVDLYKDRLFWGGKLNVWGSVPGLYSSHAPDFFGQQTTDSAINVRVPGTDAANICWLSQAVTLLIGTEGGEFALDAANYSSAPLGPANVEILRQSKWRCRHIAPHLVGPSVLYVQRAGRKVMAMDYNFYLNRYDSTDQSKFAYHISISGLTATAYSQEPWSVLWAARADGMLLSYTFNREDNVTAWDRHALGNGGKVESVSSIPAPDGSRDELWMIVNRSINGQTIRTVEYMVKPFEGPQGGNLGDAQNSAWYVDCGVQFTTSSPTNPTVITGLPPVMWGQTVAIYADGGVRAQQTVSMVGALTLNDDFSVVTIGFPYQGNLVPQRIEAGADIGTSQGKRKQGANIVVRLVDSAGGVVGQLSNINAATDAYQNPLGLTSLCLDEAERIRYNSTSTPLGSSPPIMSGDFPVSFPLNQKSDQDHSDMFLLIQQNDPSPMTVVGLYPSYKVEESQ